MELALMVAVSDTCSHVVEAASFDILYRQHSIRPTPHCHALYTQTLKPIVQCHEAGDERCGLHHFRAET